MRLPKLKGFKNRFAPSTRWSTSATSPRRSRPVVRSGASVAKGLVRKNVLVKVLGDGKLRSRSM
jgi:large subunit ribosomal protein L15